MGGQSSKSKEYEEAVQLFTVQEYVAINELIEKININKIISLNEFNTFTKNALSNNLSTKVYYYAIGNRNILDDERFFILISNLLKSTIEKKSHFLLCLCKAPNKVELYHILIEIIVSYKLCLHNQNELNYWKFTQDENSNTFVDYLLEELHEEEINAYIIETWLSKSSLLLKIFQFIFKVTFNFIKNTSEEDDVLQTEHSGRLLLPICKNVNWSKYETMLTVNMLTILHENIIIKKPWKLLFHSKYDGQSFATFTKLILNKGPCLLLIKDMDGFIFGGYTSTNLSIGPLFCGNEQSFLFQVYPKFGIYVSSGYNKNYVYFNQHQQTMPNGFGMGGQLNYFGLWIDSDFGKGQSQAKPQSTTFKSPQLSGKDFFQIDILEVWSIGGNVQLNADGGSTDEYLNKQSILDKDPEAKAMLSLLDRGPLSEGLRECDPMAESPEEHSIPPLL